MTDAQKIDEYEMVHIRKLMYEMTTSMIRDDGCTEELMSTR